MAAEITLSASLAVDNGVFDESLSRSGWRFDFSGTKVTKHVQSIGTSEEAIDLGEISTLGWILAVNLDNTNYVEIRLGTGASNDCIKLPAKGGLALFHAGSDMTAPYAIANTAACLVEFFHIAGG
jgi:hypothetical protein